MKKQISIFFCLSLFALACQKTELPKGAFSEPVFKVTYQLGQEPLVNLTAGQDSIYHFTRFRNGLNDSVLTFSGAFAPTDCPEANCPKAMTFEFRNFLKGNHFESSSMHDGEWAFRNLQPEGKTVYFTQFSAIGGGNEPIYKWKFGSDPFVPGAGVERIFNDSASLPVLLSARDINSVESSYQKTIPLINSASVCPDARILVSPDSLHEFVVFSAQTNAPAGAQFNWSTGSDAQEFKISKSLLAPSYSVTVSMAGGCSVVASVYNLSSSINYTLNSPTFEFSVQPKTLPGDTIQLGTVTIQLIDKQGIVWRSDRKAQKPSDVAFKVSDVVSYDLNERGEQTVKMKIAFHCRVFSSAGESKLLVGEGVIAVARP